MKKYGLLSMVGTAVVASTITYLYMENESNKDNTTTDNTKKSNTCEQNSYSVTTIKAPTMNNKKSASTETRSAITLADKIDSNDYAENSEDDFDTFKVHRVFDFIT